MNGETLLTQRAAQILKEFFGEDKGAILLEFILSQQAEDVARRGDLKHTEMQLRVEMERIRAELAKDIERIRAELGKEIEQVRAELLREIEQLRAEVAREIEQLRGEMQVEMERLRKEIVETKVSMVRWAFVFWATQLATLALLLFQWMRVLR